MSFILSIYKALSRNLRAIYWKFRMQEFGNHSEILNPLKINGAKHIKIGSYVTVQYKTWLASTPLTGQRQSLLVLEDGCTIGHFNHIYATHSIILHKNVLTADKVYISDNLHGYEDISIPIKKQAIIQNGTVEIGEGSWLGENVCVLGAHIGKHCVIGANSVVTKDIPDYCVAAGAPAKVIKRYDFNEKKWQKVGHITDNQSVTNVVGGKFYILLRSA